MFLGLDQRRLGLLHGRLRRGAGLFGGVEGGLRGGFLGEQGALPRLGRGSVIELGAGARQRRGGGARGGLIGGGVEGRYDLARLDAIARFHRT